MDYKKLLEAWVEKDLPLSQRVLYAYALDPTLTAVQLAEKLGTSHNTVVVARRRLVKAGHLLRENLGWRSWSYTPAM